MEQNASSARSSAEQQRRAATAYLVWPLAAAELIRESPTDPLWSRLHSRQALVFGLLASAAFLALLALPPIAVIAFADISIGATILIYSISLTLDALALAAFVAAAVRFSGRAARGELFPIPLVTPIVDSLLRLRRR